MLLRKKINRNNEIYLLKCLAGGYAAYFPLSGFVLKVNEAAAALLKRLKAGKKISPYLNAIQEKTDFQKSESIDNDAFINHLLEMGLIAKAGADLLDPLCSDVFEKKHVSATLCLTSDCNLRCIYCFADGGTHREEMSLQTGVAAIRFIQENAVTQKINNMGESKESVDLDLSFHGGGEPTMPWDLFVSLVEYFLCENDRLGLIGQLGLTTNATMELDKAKFIGGHFKSINVSLDGNPETQNRQRPRWDGGPSFNQVEYNLDLWTEMGLKPALRMTVTDQSVKDLKENIGFLIDRFHPPIIQVEPVSYCGRCYQTGALSPHPKVFIDNFFEAFHLGLERQTKIEFSGFRTSWRDKFCRAGLGNFFITPEGLVTTCLEVLKPNDERAKDFIYGEIVSNTGLVSLDYTHLSQLHANNIYSLKRCQGCYAKWNCGGDCPAKKWSSLGMNTVNRDWRCKINRGILRRIILDSLEGDALSAVPMDLEGFR